MAVLQHYEEEGCACTLHLRERFGMIGGAA
jgi:hypothetical protein